MLSKALGKAAKCACRLNIALDARYKCGPGPLRDPEHVPRRGMESELVPATPHKSDGLLAVTGIFPTGYWPLRMASSALIPFPYLY